MHAPIRAQLTRETMECTFFGSIPGNMTMEIVELHLRSFMMKLISLDGALGDIENVEGEKRKISVATLAAIKN
jgi:hypothetical protein